MLTARIFSPGRKTGLMQAIKINFSDPISILPISATVLGLVLGFTGTEFPSVLDVPRRVLVFAAVILYSISFGLGMQIRMMLKRITAYLGMLPIKFVLAPAIGYLVDICCLKGQSQCRTQFLLNSNFLSRSH